MIMKVMEGNTKNKSVACLGMKVGIIRRAVFETANWNSEA